MPQPHVVILLASYQGAPHLQVQLDSIAAQSHEAWSLVVSDDGSTDGTLEIVQRFAAGVAAGRVTLVEGPRRGATQNFLSLLSHVPPESLAAFCDQDDRWHPDKLSRAVEALASANGPVHYAARTIITDAALRPIAGSRRFHRPLGFRNAVVQACMAGNTSVFDPAAVQLLQQAAPHARRAEIVAHDWWAYQVTSAFGARMIHDPRPALLYRQHPRSEVGRNDTLPALTARLRKLLAGDFGAWLQANHASLAPLDLPPDSRASLNHLHRMLTCPGPQALRAMRQGRFYRQTRAGTAALALSALSGALRA
ncbi:glycosyltransferase [Paracoccus liaowanqingii]|uniref:Glycosyltransferase n=1 Tax=Paracoccus liaowanqingii TaxID=2560053 RepID=A0A4Z1C912_9RHOB|nr:glycosyltransferase [Paracoccus liaowanqingii]TGN54321.1 glycosyltransferase [Paracoccus liaowanqingii]